MPKIAYEPKRFSRAHRLIIDHANTIISEYTAQGFDLTLRQLYYQFVARGLIANRQTEYKRLGGIINAARLAGEVDWNAITDRTRNVRGGGGWDSPEQMIRAYASGYGIDHWEHQPVRPEVWIEKDALVGVIAGVCSELNVPYFSCRGYTSQSEMWRASQRHLRYIQNDQSTLIIHLGDHDPSGIDMSRDIHERMGMFMGWDAVSGLSFERVALNEDQISFYNPPPNPAKLTDSRATTYIAQFGFESWELDALEPRVLSDLIRDTVMDVVDHGEWERSHDLEKEQRDVLKEVANRWGEVQEFLGV